jgi:hypothetical protein
MPGKATYFLYNDTLVKPVAAPPPAENPLPENPARMDSVQQIKRQDTLAAPRKKKDTLKLIRKDTARFRLPDTIKIQYLKPSFKRPKPDSLVRKPQEEKTPEIVPFYSDHYLKVIHTNPVPLNRENGDWIFGVLLLILIAFTFIKIIHSKNLKQVQDAFLSPTISNQIVRDENILFQRASVFLTVIFYIVGALFLYKISVVYDINYPYLPSGFGRFLIFVLIISLAYSMKLIILKVIGFIFQVDKAINSYIFSVFLINNVLGIILIPILICAFFMPSEYVRHIVMTGNILVLMAFLYRIFRGITIGLSYPGFSIYYLFLYLCSLEIAPLLFLIKILK